MRRQIAIVGAGVAGLAIAGGILVAGPLTTRGVAAAEASSPPVGTATVQRRTLHATTQVSGTLGYASSYGDASDGAYSVANAVATTGTGDPTAGLQAFASAQAQYDAARNALDALRHPRATDIAQAQAQIAQVEAALVTARQVAAGATPAQISQAKAQLAQAQAQLALSRTAASGPTPEQLAQAQAQLAQAEAQLVAAQNAAAGPTQAQTAQAQAAVAQANSQLQTDQAALVAAQTAMTSCHPTPAASPDPSASPGPPATTCDWAALQLAVQQAQNRVNADQANLAAAQAALDGLNSPSSQAQAQAALASAQAQERAAQAALDALTSGTGADTQAQLDAAKAGAASALAALDALLKGDKTQARAQLDSAAAQLNAAQTALAALLNPTASQVDQATQAVSNAKAQLDIARRKLTQPRGTLTQLAPVGSVVKPGGVLYTLDGLHPVVLMDGQVPAWRDLQAGMSNGPDVRELEENLEALGYAPNGMTVDSHWDDRTTAAVKAWQRALHVSQTGTIPLGQVVFEPGELRVTSHAASLGATLQQGAAVLQATTTRRVVSIALDPSLQTQVKAGDAVTVELPDGSTASGTVSDVGTVATQPSNGSNPQSSASPTIAVTVTLDDPSAAGTLDQAPVQVDITTATAENVLAVPIPALVQLLEGGYAVQVSDNGALRYVPVTTGLFASGWVEVSGQGLAEGQTVVVAK